MANVAGHNDINAAIADEYFNISESKKNYFPFAMLEFLNVPITKYFDICLVTKTYEYLLSGIPVIATNTTRNREVVNENSDVLIQDSSEGSYQGLIDIYKKWDKWDSKKIIKQNQKYGWDERIGKFIVNKHKVINT